MKVTSIPFMSVRKLVAAFSLTLVLISVVSTWEIIP